MKAEESTTWIFLRGRPKEPSRPKGLYRHGAPGEGDDVKQAWQAAMFNLGGRRANGTESEEPEEWLVCGERGCAVWSAQFDPTTTPSPAEPLAVFPLGTVFSVRSDPAHDDAALGASRQPPELLPLSTVRGRVGGYDDLLQNDHPVDQPTASSRFCWLRVLAPTAGWVLDTTIDSDGTQAIPGAVVTMRGGSTVVRLPPLHWLNTHAGRPLTSPDCELGLALGLQSCVPRWCTGALGPRAFIFPRLYSSSAFPR